MQHKYSAEFLDARLGPPSVGVTRLLGISTTAASVLALVHWQLGGLGTARLAEVATYLVVVVLLMSVAIVARRALRPSDKLRTMVTEIDRHGLWQRSAENRRLAIGRAELVSVAVFKSRRDDVLWVTLKGRSRAVRIEGLESMHAFVKELRLAFPDVAVTEHRRRGTW
jgi:hypothetical protein